MTPPFLTEPEIARMLELMPHYTRDSLLADLAKDPSVTLRDVLDSFELDREWREGDQAGVYGEDVPL